jgi:hypothetical protein
MVIDCGRCVKRGTDCGDCGDCVIATLEPASVTGYPVQAQRHLDEAEVQAIRVLADAGLVPPLRLTLPGSSIRSAPRNWILPTAKAS